MYHFMQRPLLPIWFEVDRKPIKSLCSRILNCEIYEIMTWEYLYIFTDLNINDVVNQKLKKYKTKIISVGLDEYIWVFYDILDVSVVEKLKKNLTNTIWFESIAGMNALKNLFLQEIIEPIKNPEQYKKYKLSIPNWVLFFWPPGCWKTFISRKLAEEIGYNFYEIKHSDVASPYVHWSTGKIWEIFSLAKENNPSIVFFDELSWLVPKRENLNSTSQYKEEEINEFLIQLNDASKNNILVIWATNYPDRIDSAIMRSWRMDKRIYIWPPDFEARIDLFKMYLKDRPLKHINYERLAEITDTYVTSDIQVMCDNFARKALVSKSDITMDICENVVWEFTPSLSLEQIEYYKSFINSYQRI